MFEFDVENIKPSYVSFNQAQQQIFGLEAIDYFFAKEMLQAIANAEHHVKDNDKHAPFSLSVLVDGNNHNQNLLFHLLLALSESLRNGHSCLPINSVAGQRFGFSSDDDGFINQHGYQFDEVKLLDQLLSTLPLSVEAEQVIVYHQQRLYLRRYFQFENELSVNITDKIVPTENHNIIAIKQVINALFPRSDNAEDKVDIDWQKVAVANALNKNFSVIAGGPGTGKTYTVTKLLAALVMLEQKRVVDGAGKLSTETKSGTEIISPITPALRIALVAPTGKAAQRLSESIAKTLQQFKGSISQKVLMAIPTAAQTIHRLLGVIPNSTNFRHHSKHLLAVDVLLIDEVSMVDLALMTRVFRSLPNGAKVILLGDADQLPSVAAGSVLADLAPRPHQGFSRDNIDYLKVIMPEHNYTTLKHKGKSKPADHVTFLMHSRRFDSQGGIGKIAQAVISGQSKQSWQLLNENTANSQLSLLDDDPNIWVNTFVTQYYQPMFKQNDLSFAFNQLARFRILCATRQGISGVEHFNTLVEQSLTKKGLLSAGQNQYQGKPIMISENDYRLGLYNGDIGLLWRHANGHLMAVFENGVENTVENSAKNNSDDVHNHFKWVMISRLPSYETVYAMTIHKTQGSEFDHVAMVLPKQTDNKLLSRELLYTAITRAKSRLSISSSAGVWCHGVEAQVKRHTGLEI
jgi:exodeoxyribonuclease V alpha subunit